jgi:hypothetical protein
LGVLSKPCLVAVWLLVNSCKLKFVLNLTIHSYLTEQTDHPW